MYAHDIFTGPPCLTPPTAVFTKHKTISMRHLLQSFQAGARRLGARLVWSANMFQVPRPIDEEDLAGYRPGGYHPVRIGDHFKHGKYKVLNKLGYGGYSTVWLSRNNE